MSGFVKLTNQKKDDVAVPKSLLERCAFRPEITIKGHTDRTVIWNGLDLVASVKESPAEILALLGQSGEPKATAEPLHKTQQLQGVDREKVRALMDALGMAWPDLFGAKDGRIHSSIVTAYYQAPQKAFDAVAECLREGGE